MSKNRRADRHVGLHPISPVKLLIPNKLALSQFKPNLEHKGPQSPHVLNVEVGHLASTCPSHWTVVAVDDNDEEKVNEDNTHKNQLLRTEEDGNTKRSFFCVRLEESLQYWIGIM